MSKIRFVELLYYICIMLTAKKHTSALWSKLLTAVGLVFLITLQSLWVCNVYKLTHSQLIIDIDDAFDQAYRNEQVYRVPIGNLIHIGGLTIQGCGPEKIMIIRDCRPADTLVYDNLYGLSMEAFMNKALYELRERTLPMNIHCLSDLFAGALHEKAIQLSFVIERFNPVTEEVLESSLPPGIVFPSSHISHVIMTNMSETEGLRARLQFGSYEVFKRMSGMLTGSIILLLLIISSFIVRERLTRPKKVKFIADTPVHPIVQALQDNIYTIGKYRFNTDKRELHGMGQSVTLNKKECSILEALCAARGSVVERVKLLEDHWEGIGFIYSRSLDTYITKLRKHLKDDPAVQIITIKGVGYKLSIQ